MKVSAAVLGVCCSLLIACADRTPPEPVDQSIRPARLFVVRDARETQQYEFVGRVEAAQSIDASFEVAGPLRQLPVLEGQSIASGTLVAALDTTDFELAVRESRVQLQLARQDLERKQQMLKQRGIAKSLVHDARSVFELQKVRLEKAEESLRDAQILAPFDAYVARRYVDNFVNVSVGQKIVRLNDLHRLLVVASVPEALAATGNQEQVLDMYAVFDFLPDERFALALHEIRGEADAVAQTYETAMIMERPSQWNILPGMTASVIVEMQALDESPSVFLPSSTLVGDAQGGFHVWVYDADTQELERRRVFVGAPQAHGIPVLAGIGDGEMIVATGASQLQEGMRIRPLGEPVEKP